MFIKMNFILIIIFILILFFLNNSCEYFNENLFYKKIQNIYIGNNYLSEDLEEPVSNINTDIKSLDDITINSYIYSDIISNKIICDSYTSEANCWQNNNCQWIYKIDNNSYCDLAKKWL